MPERIRIRFDEPDRKGAEEDIALAIFAAECVYGRPRTRLSVRYLLHPDGREIVVAAEGQPGDAVLRVLLGLLGSRFGEEAIHVTNSRWEGEDVVG